MLVSGRVYCITSTDLCVWNNAPSDFSIPTSQKFMTDVAGHYQSYDFCFPIMSLLSTKNDEKPWILSHQQNATLHPFSLVGFSKQFSWGAYNNPHKHRVVSISAVQSLSFFVTQTTINFFIAQMSPRTTVPSPNAPCPWHFSQPLCHPLQHSTLQHWRPRVGKYDAGHAKPWFCCDFAGGEKLRSFELTRI